MVDLQGTPEEIYAGIVDLDEEGFDKLMADPGSRDRVVAALLEHMADRLRPDAAGDLHAVIHIKLWDRPGGGYDHHELVIRDGTCVANMEPAADPDLTLKVRPGDLRKIVTGETGPKRLAFKGRLRALGDVRLGMRLTDLFDL